MKAPRGPSKQRRFCSECGAEVPKDALFCGACGTAIQPVSESPDTPQWSHKGSLLESKTLQIAAIVGFSIVAVIGVVVAIVSESDDQHRASERYTGGRSACNDFLSAGYDAALGIIIDTELREKLRKVQSKGSTAEPAIRDASLRLLQAVTQGDTSGLEQATKDMGQACNDAGYWD